MEVNVDMLEQMDMMDLSDQDTMDVFLGCGTEESSVAGPLPGMCSPEPSVGQAGSLSSAHISLFLSPGHPACRYTHTHAKTLGAGICEAGGTSGWAGPCQYLPPQPRDTDLL